MKSCNSSIRGDETQRFVYPCHVDGLPCEVVDPIMNGLESQKVDTVADCLPCGFCKVMERDAERLAGVRLGRRQRHILLSVPPPDGEAVYIELETGNRAEKEAVKRAIRTLCRAGLLWRQRTAWGKPRWTVTLSALGAIVVKSLGKALEGGKPIRWAKHQAVIKGAVSEAKQGSAELLEKFAVEVQRQGWSAESSVRSLVRSGRWRRTARRREKMRERSERANAAKVVLAAIETLLNGGTDSGGR